jgi:FKBP-type peptidyl-prolyl cis-trans isomerase (trigger factor)
VEAIAEEAEEPAQEAAEIPTDLPEVETIPDEEEDTGPLTFNAKLISIKVKNEPALDDTFAASVSDLQSLDELKNRIRKNLVTQKEEEIKRELVDKIVKEAVESSKVVVPPIMIDSEIHAMEDSMAQRLKQQKLSLDQYLSIVGKSHEDFHEELRPQAISRINTALVLREIATAEGIAVSGDELDREVEKMVDEYISSTPEDQREEQSKRFRDIFNQKEMRDQFSENIFSRKLAERLMELATGKSFATEVVEADAIEVDSSEETPEAATTEPAATDA